jgi:hypothetical protein
MEASPVALEVTTSFEDLDISFERDNSFDELIEKKKEKKMQPRLTKNKNIRLSKDDAVKKTPPKIPNLEHDARDDDGGKSKNLSLSKDAVEKSPLEIPQVVLYDAYEADSLEKSGTRKLQTQKHKGRSFISRFRANSWSPKQSRTPEFDNIGLLHKMCEKREEEMSRGEARIAAPSYLLSYTELLYLPTKERLPFDEREKVPRFEGKSHGMKDRIQSDTKQSISPRRNDSSPRYEEKAFSPKDSNRHTFEMGGKVPTVPRNTFEESKPKDVSVNSRFEDRNPRLVDKIPKLKETNLGISGSKHPDFVDPRMVGKKSSNVSFTNATVPNGRLFLPPRNECGKNSCCTLSPNCTRRLRASSDERLPRVPSRKVSLIQAGAWLRFNDDNISSTSRNRSFTH